MADSGSPKPPVVPPKTDDKPQPEQKKETVTFRQMISKINEHIEVRQGDVKPLRTEKVLNRMKSGEQLTANEKVHLVTVGKGCLLPEERLEMTSKKKNMAQYGAISAAVAFATGLMGGLLSRRFISARPITQLGVFASIFCGSTYFQMYPIINDYVIYHTAMFDKYEPAVIAFAEKQQAIAKAREEQKAKKKPNKDN